jgi:hypothetical protein
MNADVRKLQLIYEARQGDIFRQLADMFWARFERLLKVLDVGNEQVHDTYWLNQKCGVILMATLTTMNNTGLSFDVFGPADEIDDFFSNEVGTHHASNGNVMFFIGKVKDPAVVRKKMEETLELLLKYWGILGDGSDEDIFTGLL